MEIKVIEVIGLFNMFNHRIEVKENSNLTIILGLNGLGKTAILTLINGLFSYNFDKLIAYQYSELSFTFGDGSFLRIVPFFDEEVGSMVIQFNYIKNGEKHVVNTKEINKNRDRIKHFIPSDKYRRIRLDTWYDTSTGEYYSTDELLSLNKEFLIQSNIDAHGCPEWLSLLINSIPVRMIDTKRLQTVMMGRRNSPIRESVEVQETVVEYANDFTQRLLETKAKADTIGSDLDRSYPARLIDALSEQKVEKVENNRSFKGTVSTLIKNLEELETKRRKLVSVGLMNSAMDVVFDKPIRIDEEYPIVLTVMNMYIEDSSKKMDAYREMSEKVSLFIELINKHFIKKKLEIFEDGLVIKSIASNEPIPLSKLSSGEKHLFIIFYNLLFLSPQNSLILMDEPEISLNITWQKSFVQDLMRIMALKPISIIMATHSPSIVRNYWDKTVELSPES